MKEIERKFLVTNNDFIQESYSHYNIKQGFLSDDPSRIVRIRLTNDKGFITVKGKTIGIERIEWEKEISMNDAMILIDLCKKPILEKTRYLVNFHDFIYEVDVFEGQNKGLIIAELELKNSEEAFLKPNWLGEEVSHDTRYFNSNLITLPYCKW